MKWVLNAVLILIYNDSDLFSHQQLLEATLYFQMKNYYLLLRGY